MLKRYIQPRSYLKLAIRLYYEVHEAYKIAKAPKTKWKNKIGVTFGDSLTYYDKRFFSDTHVQRGKYVFGYQYYIRAKFGCKTINKGNNGWDLTQIQATIKGFDFTGIDFVLITSGANDHRNGTPPGNVLDLKSTFDITTTAGALQSSIEHILSQNSKVQIFLATPISGFYYQSGTKDVPGPYKKETVLSRDYADVFLNVGAMYNLPVCNWYDQIVINTSNKTELLGDRSDQAYSLHPTLAGFRLMGETLTVTMDSY